MKKILILTLALCLAAGASAQEKKKGGFMNALKKGVESATGLDVSKEALFVYPEIGKWKMTVVSCEGDRATGEVTLKIAITALFDSPRYTSARVLIDEAVVAGTNSPLGLERFSADPLWDLLPSKAVEATTNRVLGVPVDAKALNVKFWVEHKIPSTQFELRDCPIVWKLTE